LGSTRTPEVFSLCSNGKDATVEQMILRALAIVGTAIACWRVADAKG
jgi:hypothetical protein